MGVRCNSRESEKMKEKKRRRARSEDKNSVVAGRVTGLGMPTRGRQQ